MANGSSESDVRMLQWDSASAIQRACQCPFARTFKVLPRLDGEKSPDFDFSEEQRVCTGKLQTDVLRVLFGVNGNGARGAEMGLKDVFVDAVVC